MILRFRGIYWCGFITIGAAFLKTLARFRRVMGRMHSCLRDGVFCDGVWEPPRVFLDSPTSTLTEPQNLRSHEGSPCWTNGRPSWLAAILTVTFLLNLWTAALTNVPPASQSVWGTAGATNVCEAAELSLAGRQAERSVAFPALITQTNTTALVIVSPVSAMIKHSERPLFFPHDWLIKLETTSKVPFCLLECSACRSQRQ